MPAAIEQYIEHHSTVIERGLRTLLPVSKLAGAEQLNEAVTYAVFSGGKRMRPVLVLLAAELCGAPASAALPAACAVEFLHAASLALDDLPCMDDAGLRRGHSAVHVVFGEELAILGALALMNEAYSIFGEVPGLLPRAIREIGVNGMVGGQAADLSGTVMQSRMEKTTALTRLTMAAGSAAAGANTADADVLIWFGHAIGKAYQICDDIADACVTDLALGKTAGQDFRHGRGSAVTELGKEAACRHACELVDRACARLRAAFGNRAQCDLLEEFAQSIAARGLEFVK